MGKRSRSLGSFYFCCLLFSISVLFFVFFGTAGTHATTANAHGFSSSVRFGFGLGLGLAWLLVGVGVGSARCLLFFFLILLVLFGWLVRLLGCCPREKECVDKEGREDVCVWMLLCDYLCYYAMLC